VPTPPSEQFCAFNPNGHAAGNCLEEAILHGFLELVERDAVALWWYNRARRPGVDLASFGEPYFQALESHYRGLGRRLWALDVTTDLGIPAFVALARADSGRFVVGFGCHLEARLGVQRALTELNQLFDPSERTPPPWDTSALGDARHLFPDDAASRRTRDDYPGRTRDDLRDDVVACVERAARLGLETLVLDQTRPDTGLAVAAVIVPGLRHFWPRFGPGRLYDVPVRLGWLARPNREEDLNPIPLFV
jgi:ribosomal protein S12 methylthiotransferase accessory factor